MSGAFARELLSVARPQKLERHPFLGSLARGEASRDAVRRWSVRLAMSASGFASTVASVLAICDEPEVRSILLGNLLEEEGVTAFVPGSGVTIDPVRAHGDMARRFARACGASDEEIAASTAAPTPWFASALAERNWIGAFAYFAIGFEANVPDTCRMLLRALIDQYGIPEEELIFLTEHMDADERHGIESASLLERVARTETARAAALDGARRGGMAWWMLHREHTPGLATATG